MILPCPQCGAKFAVDDAALGTAGRRVRCSACRHEWHAQPVRDESAAAAEQPPVAATGLAADPVMALAEPERVAPGATQDMIVPPAVASPPVEISVPLVAAPPQLAEPPRQSNAAPRQSAAAPTRATRRSSGRWIAVGWVVLLLVVAPAVGAVMLREPIVCRFPEAQSVYAQLGIPSPEASDGLIVVGSNVTTEARDGVQVLTARAEISNVGNCTRIVPLRGILVDAAGRSRGEALFVAAAPVLHSGENTTIRVEIRAPPSAVTGMVLPDLRHAGR